MGAGYPERECDVGGRPESKLARGSCFGVVSPGVCVNENLFSNRGGQPEASSSGRFTPLSFQMFRKPLSRLSMERREALLALEEGCLKKLPEEFWFLRLMKEENEEMLPGFRSRSKSEARSLIGVPSPSPKVERVGESVCSEGAFCSSFESKNGRESSKESDLGRGMEPLMVVASRPRGTS